MKDTDRSQDVLGPMMAIDRHEAAMPHFLPTYRTRLAMPTLKPRRSPSRSTNKTSTATTAAIDIMSSPSATAIATLSTLAAATSPAPAPSPPTNATSFSANEKVEITKKRKAELKRCEAIVKRLKSTISDGTRDHRYSALVHQLFTASDWIGGDLADHYQTTVAKRRGEAEKGDAAAMCDLGWWHAEGMHGCEQDECKAFEWYEKAARRGNEVAMGEAGHRLVDGVGTAKNVRYGVALTLGAAEFGYEVACYNAGIYYHDGTPLLKKNPNMAKHWLEKAVKLYKDAIGESRLSEDMVKDAERRIAEMLDDQDLMQE